MIKYLIAILFLFSCSAQRQLNKLKLNHEDVVSKSCSEWYPFKEQEHTFDSVSYKLWLKQLEQLDNQKTDSIFDTIITVKNDTVKMMKDCPKVLKKYRELIKVMPAIHDTIKIINTAKEKSLQLDLDNCMQNNTECIEKLQSKSNLNWWLLLLLTISMILNIIKLRK